MKTQRQEQEMQAVRTRERDATSQEDYTERETRERGWRIARQRESRGRGGD